MRILLLTLVLAGCQVPVSTAPEFLPFLSTTDLVEKINIPLVTVWTIRF